MKVSKSLTIVLLLNALHFFTLRPMLNQRKRKPAARRNLTGVAKEQPIQTPSGRRTRSEAGSVPTTAMSSVSRTTLTRSRIRANVKVKTNNQGTAASEHPTTNSFS